MFVHLQLIWYIIASDFRHIIFYFAEFMSYSAVLVTAHSVPCVLESIALHIGMQQQRLRTIYLVRQPLFDFIDYFPVYLIYTN